MLSQGSLQDFSDGQAARLSDCRRPAEQLGSARLADVTVPLTIRIDCAGSRLDHLHVLA